MKSYCRSMDRNVVEWSEMKNQKILLRPVFRLALMLNCDIRGI